MVRSYALTAAAITLRLYLGVALGFRLPFTAAYPAIAWLCWTPNLVAAEILLRRAVRRSGSGRFAARGPAAAASIRSG